MITIVGVVIKKSLYNKRTNNQLKGLNISKNNDKLKTRTNLRKTKKGEKKKLNREEIFCSEICKEINNKFSNKKISVKLNHKSEICKFCRIFQKKSKLKKKSIKKYNTQNKKFIKLKKQKN